MTNDSGGVEASRTSLHNQLARKVTFSVVGKVYVYGTVVLYDKFIRQALKFLPCDAIHSADYAVASCPSVRPSVTRSYAVETAKRILKLRPGSTHVFVCVYIYRSLCVH